MKLYVLYFLFFVCFASSVHAETDDDASEALNDESDSEANPDFEEDNDVLVLTNTNFDDAVSQFDSLLVEFYAPWCGHCKNLAPEYEKAAAALKAHDPPLRIAKVDATVENDVASRFDVSGYPTLKFFKNGDPVDYDGPRTASGIEQWVLEHADPNWKPPPDDVVVLDSDNFNEFINDHDLSLVEFYAPWCGHCKKLAPEYSRAAKQLKLLDPPVPLAKVDATVESSLASEYGATGYPTLIMFRRGKRYEYKGGRDERTIVEYMRGQVGDASQLKPTGHDVKSSIKKVDVTVVGFFDSDEDSAFGIFKDAADEIREDYTMYHTFDKDARKEFRANKNSVIIFYPEQFHSKHEPKYRVFELTEDSEPSMVVDFVQKYNVPLVGELTDESMKVRYADKSPLVIVFYMVDFSFDYRQATQMWRHKVVDIAKDYKDMTFVIADETKMQSMFKEFGFDDSGEEMNIGILDENRRRFPMPPMDEFDSDDIRSFINKFKAGKLKAHIKSQPKPKKQGSVVTVVGKTFEEIVMNEKKDVLIEFYAPWCGHCKKLEPIYKDLGKKYKKVKDLVIAKIDSTANDAPVGFDVSGFPTIYWVPRGDKSSPLRYEGGRELSDFVEYLEENSSVLKSHPHKDEL